MIMKIGAAYSNQNNGNGFPGTASNMFNNNNMHANGQSTLPNANKPELTKTPNQNNDDLIYDIDVRFSGPNDNSTNQTSLNKN